MTEHMQAPPNPTDGAWFTCPACGVSYQFVVLDDDLPGEWVSLEAPSGGRTSFRLCVS
jgi:hypothetical protein